MKSVIAGLFLMSLSIVSASASEHDVLIDYIKARLDGPRGGEDWVGENRFYEAEHCVFVHEEHTFSSNGRDTLYLQVAIASDLDADHIVQPDPSDILRKNFVTFVAIHTHEGAHKVAYRAVTYMPSMTREQCEGYGNVWNTDEGRNVCVRDESRNVLRMTTSGLQETLEVNAAFLRLLAMCD